MLQNSSICTFIKILFLGITCGQTHCGADTLIWQIFFVNSRKLWEKSKRQMKPESEGKCNNNGLRLRHRKEEIIKIRRKIENKLKFFSFIL